MEKLFVFGILSMVAVIISWHTVFHVKSHGFYRFFSWIFMIWIFSNNYPSWFTNPFSAPQLLSWIFLVISLYLAVAGLLLIKRIGKPDPGRQDKTLYNFEKTSELIEYGLYKYIRHPLYFSLILLCWGIYLKNPTLELSVFAILSTILLYLTSRRDEKECIEYFQEKYKDYMKRTKMFIPFIF